MAESRRQAALQRSAPIPFQGSNNMRDFTSTDLGNVDETEFDQLYENCYLTTVLKEQKSEEAPQFVLKKRPGWTQVAAPAANTEVATALHYWNAASQLLSAWGTTTSTIYKDTTSVTTLTSNRTVRFFSSGLSGTTQRVIWTTNTYDVYYYDGSTVTEITDADMPGNNSFELVGPAISMDGYLFVGVREGRIYNSSLDDWTAWSALDFISTNMYEDFLVGLARYKNQLMAFGRKSIEFYTNVGNPVASPLQRNLTIAINIGCVSQYTYCNTEDTVAWIGTPAGGRMGLYYLDGYTPVKIDDPKLDWYLKFANLDTLRLQTLQLDGYEWLHISSSAMPPMLYNKSLKTWCLWSSTGGVEPWRLVASDHRSMVYGVNNADNATTNGKTFKMSVDTYQDASTNYDVLFISPLIDFGTSNQKRMYKLKVLGDKQTSTTTTTVKTSDDDYRTWVTRGTVDMNTFNTNLYQLGSFRRRSVRLEYTGSNPWRVHKLEADFSFGVH